MALVAAVVLAGCAGPLPVGEPETAGRFRAACLPNSQLMCDALRAKGLEAEVLLMEFSNARVGHAVVAYRWQGRTWVWDEAAWTFETGAKFADPMALARAWQLRTRRGMVRHAFFYGAAGSG